MTIEPTFHAHQRTHKPVTTMTSFTKTQLLKRLSSHQGPVKNGFNLIELMIVVSITGMLSVVAIPQYQNVKNKADTNSKIAEAIGLARECAVFQIEADPVATTVQNPGGTEVTCGGAPLAQQTILSRAFTIKPGQTYTCLDKTMSGGAGTTTESKAEILVSIDGAMSCEFSVVIGDVYPPDGTING